MDGAPFDRIARALRVPSLAEITIGPAEGAEPLFLLVAAAGAAIAVLGIAVVLVVIFRGATDAEAGIGITLPGGGGVAFDKIGQGAMLAVIGGIVMIGALYLVRESRAVETTHTEGSNALVTPVVVVHTAD